MSDPTTQMTTPDLDAQEQRIYNAPAFNQVDYVATTYYGNNAPDKIQQGELDIILLNQDVDTMIVCNSIADVTIFLNSYDYMGAVLGLSPIGYWRLGDSATGQAADISGNAYNGTLAGGVTTGQSGAILNDPNTAMLFDGSTGYISLPNALNTAGWTALSVACWFKASVAPTAYWRLMSNAQAMSSYTGFDITLAPSSDGHFGYFEVGRGNSSAAQLAFGTAIASASTWYHVVAVYSNGAMTVYINSTQAGNISATNLPIAAAASPIHIGNNTAGNVNYFNGVIDEVAIFPYALSAQQVLSLYQAGTTAY